MKGRNVWSVAIAVCGVLTGAVAAEPEQFILPQSPMVIRVDAQRALALPMVEKLYKSQTAADKNDADDELGLLQKVVAVDMKQFFAGQAWACAVSDDCEDTMVVIKTGLNEVQWQKLFENAAKTAGAGFELKTTVLQGKKLYIIARLEDDEHGYDEAVAVVYLAEDVVMFTELENMTGRLLSAVMQSAANSGGNALVTAVDRKALAALQMDCRRTDGRNLKNFNTVAGTFDLTAPGKDQRAELNLLINCSNKKKAQQTAMQLQFMVPGMIGMAFSNDEQLAMAMSSALKVNAQDDNLSISYSVTVAMLEKAFFYLMNPANRMLLKEDRTLKKD